MKKKIYKENNNTFFSSLFFSSLFFSSLLFSFLFFSFLFFSFLFFSFSFSLIVFHTNTSYKAMTIEENAAYYNIRGRQKYDGIDDETADFHIPKQRSRAPYEFRCKSKGNPPFHHILPLIPLSSLQSYQVFILCNC
jgi:hypothetical protein